MPATWADTLAARRNAAIGRSRDAHPSNPSPTTSTTPQAAAPAAPPAAPESGLHQAIADMAAEMRRMAEGIHRVLAHLEGTPEPPTAPESAPVEDTGAAAASGPERATQALQGGPETLGMGV